MNSCISQKFKKLKTYLCTTVTMGKAIKFLTSMRPSSLSSYRSTCEQNMASLQKLQSLFWWPKSWSHRCQHMWIILLCGTLTFMNSSNPLLLLLPLSLTLIPHSSPLHQHRLLLVSRSVGHCPKAESTAQGWVWASASSPHPPLFKHLPASENIPHCLSSRDGGDLSQNVSIAKDNTLENGLKNTLS